ncbi:MAG: winged helix-turn-helix domain-containing protein [Candidatus Omnitrophica bacterium]|nr:winged helix-turn-helix domain-containing protein [Candidatus Omnitrophota bacterium]
MITQIGITSGDILNLIDQKQGPVSLDEVRSHLNNEEGLTDMSIGWLVREGHVHWVNKGDEKYLQLPERNNGPKRENFL